MKKAIRHSPKSESGGTLVEYAILIMLVSLILIIPMGALALQLAGAFDLVLRAFD